MKKMRTLLFCTLALCLAFAGALVLTGCKDKNPGGGDKSDKTALNAVAGTYTNSWYTSSRHYTMTFEIKTDKTWKQTQTRVSGVEKSESVITGKFEINAQKQITELTFDDPAAVVSEGGSSWIFGTAVPDNSGDLNFSQSVLEDAVAETAEMYKKMISFGDGYVMIMGEGATILYKDAANKLAKGTVLKTYTEKEMYELENMFEESMFEGNSAKYESDYYYPKQETEIDLTNAEDKQTALSMIFLMGMVVDEYGNAGFEQLEITDIDALKIAETGTRTSTLTYKTGATTATRTASYTIVKSEYELPLNGVMSFYGIRSGYSPVDGVLFAHKGTEFHSLRLSFVYNSFDEDYTNIDLDDTNCTGDNKLFTVGGYNKDTAGLQTVTVTFLGKDYKQLVFVYDETVNPVVDAEGSGGVVITKNGDSYTADYTNATATLTKADGTTEDKTFAAADAIDLGELSGYETGDHIVFKVEATYGGQTYTFYVKLSVTVIDATPVA